MLFLSLYGRTVFVCLFSPDRIEAHRLFFRSLAIRVLGVFQRCARLSDIFIYIYICVCVCVHVFEVLANYYDVILEDEKKERTFHSSSLLAGVRVEDRIIRMLVN